MIHQATKCGLALLAAPAAGWAGPALGAVYHALAIISNLLSGALPLLSRGGGRVAGKMCVHLGTHVALLGALGAIGAWRWRRGMRSAVAARRRRIVGVARLCMVAHAASAGAAGLLALLAPGLFSQGIAPDCCKIAFADHVQH